jgi:hypothetical protein
MAADGGVADVVHDHVEAPEFAHRRLDRPAGRGRVGHVERHGPDPGAVARHEVVELLRPAWTSSRPRPPELPVMSQVLAIGAS